MTGSLNDFWSRYVGASRTSDLPPEPYDAEPFGDMPELADELGRLIVLGTKTATCSCLWEWEAEDSAIPVVGRRIIVLDGRDVPLCIIETTDVEIRPFREVDEAIAYDEGEGDRSIEYWRRVHWDYFSRVLAKIGRTPSEEMPLVCERFRMIYKGVA